MGHLGDLLARLDEDRFRRGKQFERVCKWFLTNDPLYRHQVRRVWLWDEWPGRWGADAGIDLVVEDREGGLWAVQSKAYDPGYGVTKADVNTFLSESSRSQFSYRLLIATTNRVGQTARRTIAAQEKQAGLLLLADLVS
jgi:predicted helicase